jgi:hypothetical protein
VDVVAQWVRTVWTKQSQGGDAATRRNALPVAFTLPAAEPPLTHWVVMREWRDGFAPQSSVVTDRPDRGDVQLREADGLLRVKLENAQWSGVIRRRPPAVRLRPGEWMRWQITYRRASALGRGTWYCSVGTPNRYVDERRQLTTYGRVQ